MSFQGGNRVKKVFALLFAMICLTGCRAQETFETVEDIIPAEPVAVPQQFFVSLPDDAVTPTFQDESGEIYVCQDYTVTKQITESGDLAKTIRDLTGQAQEDLQVIKTIHDMFERYDFVWTATGEEGLQLGRACILDDGNYHYALSTLTREESAGELRQTIQDVFDSCKLLDPDINLSTGS
jgi:hypothetical protein